MKNSTKTFDIQFSDSTDSNNKGFSESLDFCKDYIKSYNGGNDGYFQDYKGGTVSIVCNEDEEVVYTEVVK